MQVEFAIVDEEGFALKGKSYKVTIKKGEEARLLLHASNVHITEMHHDRFTEIVIEEK